MAFYHFKNIPLTLNNNTLFLNEASLESQVDIIHPLKLDERNTDRNLSNSPYQSLLRLKYYCTGADFLKSYLYSLENETITGNFAGLIFRQAYVADYSTTLSPNSPVEINCGLQIYDKISGAFNISNSQNNTGLVLRMSDATINNFSNYTTNTINNIIQATFTYSANLNPAYSYDISGIPPLEAERVSIEERKWSIEIISDSTNLDIPISGDKFAINVCAKNPYDNSINENFACSGIISYKQFNVNVGKVHSHILKINQSSSSSLGSISGVIINSNSFDVISTPNSHPFTNNGLQCIDKIIVGDTICTGFIVNKLTNNDTINVPFPTNLTNGPLSIFSSKGNFLWANTLNFTFPNISIAGISQNSGYPGTPIYISGNNFYRVSQVNYGGVNSSFQIISPQLILSIVPPNGITSKIQVISDLRQLTGYSNNLFFCQPSITLFTPVTGVWKDNIVIGGTNFSGTIAVQFGSGYANAYSFNVLDNSTLSVQTPNTGAGYADGYITILTSGGSTQSISRYIPEVSLYSFSGLSGIYFDKVNLSLTVDTGYLCPISGGYKIRMGGVDTVFYQNGTGLTGQVPFGGKTDYIHIYKPNQISSYTPNSNQYIVHAIPQIYSVTPATINQYQYVSPVLIGQNFEFFNSELSYFFAISGGINGDMQTGKNILANSGNNADTIYIPNLIVTGSTGYYDLLVQNFAGIGIFKSGLLVNTGINQAITVCTASISSPNLQLNNNYAGLAIDNSTGTFAGMICNTTPSGVTLNVSAARNNGVMNVSLVKLSLSNVSIAQDVFGGNQGGLFTNGKGGGPIYSPTVSGAVSFWYKKANKPFYSSPIMNLLVNSTFILFNSGITGVQSIKVHTPDVASSDHIYLGVSELQIY